MISSWIVKIVVVVAVLGFVIIEVGSPLIVRITLDSAAHQAADDAARELTDTRNVDMARAAAVEQANQAHAELQNFEVDAQRKVRVTLFKKAKSYVLHNFEQTRGWYDVRVSASAASK